MESGWISRFLSELLYLGNALTLRSMNCCRKSSALGFKSNSQLRSNSAQANYLQASEEKISSKKHTSWLQVYAEAKAGVTSSQSTARY